MSYDDRVPNPYTTPAKRLRNNEGVYDPNQARRLDVGFQSVKVNVDGAGIRAQLMEAGSILPPISTAAFTVNYGDCLFMMENGESATPLVRTRVNGLDAQFARLYAGDSMMQRLALKQTIRPIGVAAEPVKVTPDSDFPQVAAQYAGLFTPEVISAKAGARLVWDVRRYTDDLAANTSRSSSDTAGEYQNAYGLVLEAYSEETVGKQFNKMASELVNNSHTWERAMAGHYLKARPWLSAVLADFRHCQTALILGINLLLENGVITANALELAGARSSADRAALIANFMGLTSPTDTQISLLDAAGTAKWQTFTHQFAEALYYTSSATTGGNLAGTVNAAVEFGASLNGQLGPQFAGRHPDGSVADDRIGSVLKLQCSHTAQAVAAMAQAVSEVDKFTAGTAMSGAPNGKCLMMLHKG